jgi:O-antigen/teichoic acid export membrane protein
VSAGGVRSRAFLGQLSWAATGELCGKAALLVTTVEIARGTTPNVFGQFIAYTAVAMVAAGIWDFGLSTLVTRAVASGEVTVRSALKDLIRLRVRVCPIWLLLFIAGMSLVHATQVAVVAPFLVASLLFASHTGLSALLRAQFKFRSVAIAWAAGRVTCAVATVTLVVAHSSISLSAAGWAFAGGEAVTALGLAAVLMGSLSRKAYPASQPLRLRDSLPLAANGLLSLAYNRLDVVLLSALAGAAQLTQYAPASRFQDALYLIPFVLSSVALPLMASVLATSSDKRIVGRLAMKLSLGSLVFALPTASVMFVMAPRIVTDVLGSEYRGSVTSVRILIWFLPLSAAVSPILASLIVANRFVDTSKVFAISFTTSLVLHLALDPRFGSIGGAIATLGRDIVALPVATALAFRAGLFRVKSLPSIAPPKIRLKETL